jgi:hypothetical protein
MFELPLPPRRRDLRAETWIAFLGGEWCRQVASTSILHSRERVFGTQGNELKSTYVPLTEEGCIRIAGRDRNVLDLPGLES